MSAVQGILLDFHFDAILAISTLRPFPFLRRAHRLKPGRQQSRGLVFLGHMIILHDNILMFVFIDQVNDVVVMVLAID